MLYMINHSRLTPERYLKMVHDRMRLRRSILLTPVAKIAHYFSGKKKGKEWPANGATVYSDVKIGKRRRDVILCLPGASMALITMEEAAARGVRDFKFIGTAGAVKGRIAFGESCVNGRVMSLLNPFEEHERWNEISNVDLVDMETSFLRQLAAKRKWRFEDALIVTDAIWKNHWEQTDDMAGSLKRGLRKIELWLKYEDETIRNLRSRT